LKLDEAKFWQAAEKGVALSPEDYNDRLCTKSVSAAQKERGQAHLPNLELIKS